MSDLDPRAFDLRRLTIEASRMDCPNGPDEDGNWPCDPKGYFGVAECQVCGRVGIFPRNPEPSSRPYNDTTNPEELCGG
jgi:hypothetical protein